MNTADRPMLASARRMHGMRLVPVLLVRLVGHSGVAIDRMALDAAPLRCGQRSCAVQNLHRNGKGAEITQIGTHANPGELPPAYSELARERFGPRAGHGVTRSGQARRDTVQESGRTLLVRLAGALERDAQVRRQGASQAMLLGTGLTEEDLAKPQIGIASNWWEGNTCNMHLNDLAALVREGVVAADMVSMRFNTIGVSDGISMGTPGMRFSLVSREVIADSIETVVAAEGFDGFVAVEDVSFAVEPGDRIRSDSPDGGKIAADYEIPVGKRRDGIDRSIDARLSNRNIPVRAVIGNCKRRNCKTRSKAKADVAQRCDGGANHDDPLCYGWTKNLSVRNERSRVRDIAP